MDPIKLHRETVEIEGGRLLYNYTFEIDKSEAPEPGAVSDEEEGPAHSP